MFMVVVGEVLKLVSKGCSHAWWWSAPGIADTQKTYGHVRASADKGIGKGVD